MVRADAGFFDQELFGFLEQRKLAYIVAARLTTPLKREAKRIAEWRALDEGYAVGECCVKLTSSPAGGGARTSAAARTIGRQEAHRLAEYTVRAFVTSLHAPMEEIWRATIAGRTWQTGS